MTTSLCPEQKPQSLAPLPSLDTVTHFTFVLKCGTLFSQPTMFRKVTPVLATAGLASIATAQNQTLSYSSMTSSNVNVTYANTTKINFATTIPLHTREGVASTTSSYELVTTYNSSNFFTDFTFFTGADPTNGYVDYLTYAEASAEGLAYITDGDQIYMGVDSTTVDPTNGRASVRVSSNDAYNHGLFIADIVHMPGDICGVWYVTRAFPLCLQ